MKTNGPGVYDDLASEVRSKAHARGVLLVVFDGNKGQGFSAQLPADILITVPEILREAARKIELMLTES